MVKPRTLRRRVVGMTVAVAVGVGLGSLFAPRGKKMSPLMGEGAEWKYQNRSAIQNLLVRHPWIQLGLNSRPQFVLTGTVGTDAERTSIYADICELSPPLEVVNELRVYAGPSDGSDAPTPGQGEGREE